MSAIACRLNTTFTSLRNRDFRWLWLGRLASSATFEMSGVVQGWLVYYLTGSAFALGWVSAGWSVSTLVLSLYGGAVSDRVSKRALLLWTRVAMAVNSLLIGLLISLDVIQVWHLAASSLATGVLFAFMMPAQQAIISDLVDRETLLNANSLNAVGMGLMGIFSASLAGQLIETVGPAAVYYVMTAAYIGAVFTIIKLPDIGPVHLSRGTIWVDLMEGIGYLKRTPILLTLLGLGLVRVLFAMPYRTLMPAFARNNMGLDARGLGLLMASPGLGGLLSSLFLCSQGNPPEKGRILLGSGIGMGLALLIFPQVRLLGLTLVFLALSGALNNVAMVMNSTLLQAHADAVYRGRVLSVYMMLWGLTPLGTLPAGFLADKVGVPPVIAAQGIMVVLLFALAWRRPNLLELA
ncbi:MAG: MFS transporter [Chloroflexi bacterium]|nr:MFS transporter [Chloroflexota bacterium]